MRLIELLEEVDERLVTPETRRRVEELMEEIEAGKIGYDEALEKAVSEYMRHYQRLEDGLRQGSSEIAESIRVTLSAHLWPRSLKALKSSTRVLKGFRKNPIMRLNQVASNGGRVLR